MAFVTEIIRTLEWSENPGVPVLFGGHNLSFLVEIGLTDQLTSGSDMAPPGDDRPGYFFTIKYRGKSACSLTFLIPPKY